MKKLLFIAVMLFFGISKITAQQVSVPMSNTDISTEIGGYEEVLINQLPIAIKNTVEKKYPLYKIQKASIDNQSFYRLVLVEPENGTLITFIDGNGNWAE